MRKVLMLFIILMMTGGFVNQSATAYPMQSWDAIKETQSQEVKAMVKSAGHVRDELEILNPRVRTLSDNLELAADYLDYSRKLQNFLKGLNSTLSSLNKVTLAAQGLPNAGVRNKAEEIHSIVNPIYTKVASVYIRTTQLEMRIKPVRENIDRAAVATNDLYWGIELINPEIYDWTSRAAVNVQNCINQISDSDTKECSQAKADEVAIEIKMILDELEQVLILLNRDIEMPDCPDILSTFGSDMSKIVALKNSIKNFNDKLKGPVKKIKNVLDERIHFEFAGYTLEVSVEDILEGSAKIQDIAEKYLSEAGWTVLKMFHLDEAVQHLQNAAANKLSPLLDPIEDLLDFSIDPNLTLLDDTMDEILKAVPADYHRAYSLPWNFDRKTHEWDLPNASSDVNYKAWVEKLSILKSPNHPWNSPDGCKELDLCD